MVKGFQTFSLHLWPLSVLVAICEYDPTTHAIIELGFFRRWVHDHFSPSNMKVRNFAEKWIRTNYIFLKKIDNHGASIKWIFSQNYNMSNSQ